MAMFNSFLYVYQRVSTLGFCGTICSHNVLVCDFTVICGYGSVYQRGETADFLHPISEAYLILTHTHIAILILDAFK